MRTIQCYPDAVAILKGALHVSARTDAHMKPYEEREGRTLTALRAFHRSWLMYQDGEAHAALRRQVTSAIASSPRIDSGPAVDELAGALRRGRLTHADIERTAATWQRDLLGLTTAQQAHVHALGGDLLDFFLRDRVPAGGISQLERELEILHAWFATSTFAPGRILAELVARDVPDATALSVIVDSFEPVVSAIASLVLVVVELRDEDVSARTLATETLRRHPPFRRIQRVSVDDPHDVTSIDLLAVNREPEAVDGRHLSFGCGRHACPGGNASMILLSDVAAMLLDARRRYTLVHTAGRHETTFGRCRAVDLEIDCTPIR